MSWFDPSSFTTTNMLMELAASSPESRLMRGAPGETREFIARANTSAVPVSGRAMQAWMGEMVGIPKGSAPEWATDMEPGYAGSLRGLAGKVQNSGRHKDWDIKWAMMADVTSRLVVSCAIKLDTSGGKMKVTHNPHNFLPLCTDDSAYGLTRMYAMAYTKKDFMITSDQFIVEGDFLRISCTYGPTGHIELKKCDILSIYDRPMGTNDACQFMNLKELFD